MEEEASADAQLAAQSMAATFMSYDTNSLREILTFISKILEQRIANEPQHQQKTGHPTASQGATPKTQQNIDNNRTNKRKCTTQQTSKNSNIFEILTNTTDDLDMHVIPETQLNLTTQYQSEYPQLKQSQPLNINTPNPTQTSQSIQRKQTTPSLTDTTYKIPPIILRQKEKWTHVSNLIKTRKINYTRATIVKEGVSILPSTESDYREMYKILENEKLSFHTYQLKSEKSLKVIMRGIIQEIPTEDIQKDLEVKKYEITRITRLNGRDGLPSPLVAIELKREYKSIFDLKTCCGLSIQIESKRLTQGPIQCHKCQVYGHTQPNCHAPYKCLKCAGAHSTHLCEKAETLPALCANCGGPHPANFRNCPAYPKDTQRKTTQIPTNTNRASYSNAAKTSEQPPRAATNKKVFNETITELLNTFYSTKPNQVQATEFMNKIATLYTTQNNNGAQN